MESEYAGYQLLETKENISLYIYIYIYFLYAKRNKENNFIVLCLFFVFCLSFNKCKCPSNVLAQHYKKNGESLSKKSKFYFNFGICMFWTVYFVKSRYLVSYELILLRFDRVVCWLTQESGNGSFVCFRMVKYVSGMFFSVVLNCSLILK